MRVDAWSAIYGFQASTGVDPWVGRKLYALFQDAGLTNAPASAVAWSLTAAGPAPPPSPGVAWGRMVTMELHVVRIEKPADLNVILGQAHFIKTVEDLHEALVGSSPHLRFGLAFCEASGKCLVRRSGNDRELVDLAVGNAQRIGAGHCFVVLLRDGYPVNVMNQIGSVPEVCTVYCATANAVEVVVAETELGRGILGVVDGSPPVGVETEDDVAERKALLRSIGYKL